MLSFHYQNKRRFLIEPIHNMQIKAHLQDRETSNSVKKIPKRKRASAFISKTGNRRGVRMEDGSGACRESRCMGAERGSMTIEAAVVLPVFLIALLSILYMAYIFFVQLSLIGPLHETGRRLARDLYLYELTEEGGREDPSVLQELLVKTMSVTAAKAVFVNLAGKEWLESAGIEGGSTGISFVGSSLPDEDKMVDLVIRYRMQIPFRLISLPGFSITQRCRVHGWVGYDPAASAAGEEEEQMVYVTETGSVYHLYLTCSHLHLSIRAVGYWEIEGLRNSSGAKYYPCEKCGAVHTDTVYITDDGNRYHSCTSCSGLKRGIREIPISEVGELPLCSRCGTSG